MDNIKKVKALSIWIFIVPFVAVNTCLILITQFHELFPNKENNIRYPHIGIVIINDGCEIGCGSTIDRGSLSNTIIGKNTFLDNQVHIAQHLRS